MALETTTSIFTFGRKSTIFRPAIEFGMALLPAEAFHFRDGDTGNARFAQRFLHFIELERLDNRLDFLHRHFLDFFVALSR